MCSDWSVITICAQDSPVHRRIQGISSWLIEHCLFANLICQFSQTRRYRLPVLGYSWHSLSICWPMIEDPKHQRILEISLWQIQHCLLADPIWQSKQTRQHWVLMSQNETSAHLFVVKPQLLLGYYSGSHRPLIGLPLRWKQRHCLGFLCSTAAFPTGVFLAYDWRYFTTEIINPVQNQLPRNVWSQLWQSASHYWSYHSSPATLQ